MIELPVEEIVAKGSVTEWPIEGRAARTPSVLGHTREGREIHGYRLGSGPLRSSLIADHDTRLARDLDAVASRALRRARGWLDLEPFVRRTTNPPSRTAPASPGPSDGD